MAGFSESQMSLNLNPEDQGLKTPELSLEQKEVAARILIARKFGLTFTESNKLYAVPPDAVKGGTPGALLIRLPIDNDGTKYRAERSFRVYFDENGRPTDVLELSPPKKMLKHVPGHH